MTEELVQLYDEAGKPSGIAPRSRVRAENLRHAATAIVVFNDAGELYVHQRTDTKDVFPGLFDFAAGGVLAAGESPDDGAARELAEELGIDGVSMTPIGQADYADAHTSYRAFLYRTVWNGPIRMQPEEVQWGGWMSLTELQQRIAADPASFVPDSVALWPHLTSD